MINPTISPTLFILYIGVGRGGPGGGGGGGGGQASPII